MPLALGIHWGPPVDESKTGVSRPECLKNLSLKEQQVIEVAIWAFGTAALFLYRNIPATVAFGVLRTRFERVRYELFSLKRQETDMMIALVAGFIICAGIYVNAVATTREERGVIGLTQFVCIYDAVAAGLRKERGKILGPRTIACILALKAVFISQLFITFSSVACDESLNKESMLMVGALSSLWLWSSHQIVFLERHTFRKHETLSQMINTVVLMVMGLYCGPITGCASKLACKTLCLQNIIWLRRFMEWKRQPPQLLPSPDPLDKV